MRTLFTLLGLLSYFMTFAQFCGFETPEVFASDYIDTGDPLIPHALINNANEPSVNWPTDENEIGFNARYEPYDNPDIGLTDGDAVGVTDTTNEVGEYPNGNQGYVISDVDGNFILEFDPVVIASSNPSFSLYFYIAETGYEGDGTNNASGSDRLRIYVRHLEENTEYDVLDTTGFDINDLGIEGQWMQGMVELPGSAGSEKTFQVVIEARNNSSSEAFYFDNLEFNQPLNLSDWEDRSLKLYPNPANDFIFLSAKQNKEPYSLEFFDVLGKCVFKTLESNGPVYIGHLSSGMYFVRISHDLEPTIQKLIIR